MTNDSDKLIVIPLEEATPDQQQQLAKLIVEQTEIAVAQRTGHRCWMMIPNAVEVERMRKYPEEKCPQCQKGRLVLQVYHGNIGDSINLVCKGWGNDGCGFKEYISDDEGI